VTGRRRLSLPLVQIFSTLMIMLAVAEVPFSPSLYGEKVAAAG
jgi:hypothetical protein